MILSSCDVTVAMSLGHWERGSAPAGRQDRGSVMGFAIENP